MRPADDRPPSVRRPMRVLLLLVLLGAAGLRAEGKEFSIVVLPDPQHYASKFTKLGLAQTDWVCNNAEKLQIKFVVTVGDNVDNGDSDRQFKNSVHFMSKLDGVVPYGMTCGNHDLRDATKDGFSSRKFVEYYGPQRFTNCAWYGGASASGFSSYQTISAGGHIFLMIELAISAPKAEVQWAKKVLAEHPKMPAILTTHQMLTPHGELDKGAAVKTSGHQRASRVWKQLVETSPQIFLVLCGHYHGEARLTKNRPNGRPVHVVLQDYQQEPNGGNGWLRIFTFRPQRDEIAVQTYSPTLREYKKGPRSEFILHVDFKRL
jgi:hypothetical protein